MAEIMTGRHQSQTKGFASFREWIVKMAGEGYQKGSFAFPFTGKTMESHKVAARIDCGRWLVDCPDCGGAEYADPDDPFMFCLSCGNVSLAGNARLVIFPKNRAAIEAAVLERPVEERAAGNVVARAMHARPAYPLLARSWVPGESVADLRAQHRHSKALAALTPTPLPQERARVKKEMK